MGIALTALNGSTADAGTSTDVDVVVVGAGFAGLYLLHRLRGAGLSAKVFETADDVGGTWYWNRYPGARCDVQSLDYSYSFDPQFDDEWRWSEKYATQPEILRYLQHVTERLDLRRDIEFSTRVEAAAWDDTSDTWRVRTDQGAEVTCRYFVMATGCLSVPKTLDIEGVDRFRGDVHFTSRWPHAGVDFTGKRVAVIGTGSSAIQSIPIIAQQASSLTVFQRTPNFSIPAHNGAVPERKLAALDGRRAQYREEARWSGSGVPMALPEQSALMVTEDERNARYEAAWADGGIIEFLGTFNDILTNPVANDTLAEFVRGKIRSIVQDPVTAEALGPTSFPIGTKRLCVDTNYYETYNLPHVRLVDLRKHPLATITETGLDIGGSSGESMDFDAIVFATGFDAMTGAVVAVDIEGRGGLALKDKWAHGPQTYLGLTIAGFPNLFTITGPGSPSVLSNMVVSIEQHVDWIMDCIEHMRSEGLTVIEPTESAESGWVQHVNDFADITLFPQANSWYMGANVPGKPRVFLPYVGGVDRYRTICDEVVAGDYVGFALTGPSGSRTNEDVVRRVQPDVAIMLELLESLALPSFDTMTHDEARAFSSAMATQRPQGPEVGEIVDGTFPGAAGPLDYRLYRPATPGPHPVVVYFHGGGWVLGSHESDDPFCRDLCVRSGVMVVSANYRHAPEARFPAAPDDGYAAVQWVAANADSLGAVPGQLAVAGWSAGANIAAVVCQTARDAGGPSIVGQLLLNPVTDSDVTRGSYVDNASGYLLTAALMSWFWDHYADPADRTHPKAAPLRAADLSGLPPALVVTCEFDPLRDEGAAYADALAAAGVAVEHLACRGHIHTSLTAVDVILSGADARATMAAAVRGFFRTSVPA
jgi:cation diffusion facilitator CzcD-associated flavoprotein CzcO/acetyl esterase/lipase